MTNKVDVDVSEAVEALSLALWAVDPTRYTSGGWSANDAEPVGMNAVRIILRHRSGVETSFVFTRGEVTL